MGDTATEYTIGYWIGVVIGAMGVGLVCGLIPLVAGAHTQQKRLGTIAFAACIAGSLILGAILAVPLALSFTIVIVVRWNRRPHAQEQTATTGPDPSSGP
jgi:hypothetical protein